MCEMIYVRWSDKNCLGECGESIRNSTTCILSIIMGSYCIYFHGINVLTKTQSTEIYNVQHSWLDNLVAGMAYKNLNLSKTLPINH